MSWLTDDERTQMRADVLETLPDTCTIQRLTTTTVNYAPRETWTTVLTSVACRLDPKHLRDSTGIVAEREAMTTYYTLTIPYDTAIEADDRVVHDSVTYEITQLHDKHSDRLVRRLEVAQIQGTS